jgi:hypothetical protein
VDRDDIVGNMPRCFADHAEAVRNGVQRFLIGDERGEVRARGVPLHALDRG